MQLENNERGKRQIEPKLTSGAQFFSYDPMKTLSKLQQYTLMFGVAVCYFVSARLGMTFAFEGTNATPIWVPTGIALAAVLLTGYRIWPAIFTGAFLVNLQVLYADGISITTAIPVSLLTAMGNSLEAIIGCYLIRLVNSSNIVLDSVKGVRVFIFLGAVFATLISASIGTITFCVFNSNWGIFNSMLMNWWGGDILGALIVAPVILTWSKRSFAKWKMSNYIELIGFLFLLILTSFFIFDKEYNIEYLLIPIFLVFVFRFGQFETSLAILITSGLAVWETYSINLRDGLTPGSSVLIFQIFIGVIAITFLVLSAILAERKKAEAKLLQSEQQFRLIYDNVADMIVVLDLHGRRVYNNPSYKPLLGNADSLSGTDSFKDIHPEDRERIKSIFQETIKTGIGQRSEYRLIDKEGNIHFIESNGSVIHNGNGEVANVVVVSRDVTARKIIEEELKKLNEELELRVNQRTEELLKEVEIRKNTEIALKESEQRLENILNYAPILVYINDLKGRYLFVNKEFERLVELSSNQIINKTDLELFPKERAERNIQQNRSVITSKQAQIFENASQKKDGTHYFMDILFPILDNNNEIYATCGWSIDITDRKKMERELELSVETANAIIDSMPIPTTVASIKGGRIIRPNKAMAEFHKIALEQFENMTVYDWYVHPEERDKIIAELKRDGIIHNHEVQFKRFLNGEVRESLVSLIPINYMGEECVVGSIIDISDLKKIQSELVEAKENAESADQLKSAFLATMSHELRTPLNSIIGFTGILMKQIAGPLNDEQQKQLGMVKGSAQHLLALINDVLDISKIEAGQLVVSYNTFNFSKMIQKVTAFVQPLADKKNIKLISDIDSSVTELFSDERRVEQVLINIINNAIKFTETGFVKIKCVIVNDNIHVEVIDSGIGIKKEDMDKLFKPFSQVDTGLTRNHEGTGLGLSISQKLVEKLNGTISVKSEIGAGSTFTLTFPLAIKNLSTNKT